MNTLKFEQIIAETKQDKNLPQKYLQELYDYNMDFVLPVSCTGPLSAIKCYYPLPTRLLLTEFYSNTHKIVKTKNTYEFWGQQGNRIVFADKKLPWISEKEKYPIPFAFPINRKTDKF